MEKFTVIFDGKWMDEQQVIKNVSSVMALENDQCVVSSDEGTFILDHKIHFNIRIMLGEIK